ncbi:GNAT family N-acetyltransferase [Rhodobacter sp. NTK016B]|uniref:GNAT family N-acetyltransferase n=1 Tax=Rhodobacter sp. NTK016B TaxID=2759676 RepID=UPI001A8F0CE7|nr:GNAT family protein [Rhodobacter sp. NTK016B]MBN8290903.1 GNAT family N-acetyltransferase [Rhodobacter sp. NTK016B]
MTDLSSWSPPQLPPRTDIKGRYVTLEPLARAHAEGLFAAYAEDGGAMWDYLPVGPFADQGAYIGWLDAARLGWDPLHFAVRMEDGRLGGTMSLMRIDPRAGSAEAGWLTFAPRLQRTREATEAVYRLMEWCFEAGYRRFEWKCHAANLPSRRAAQRFGLSYEGVFRQAGVVKGGNRDTAWYAAIDLEWPALKGAFETWLDPANFRAEGGQKQSLAALTRPVLAALDPLVG